jgi:hypothetical protein
MVLADLPPRCLFRGFWCYVAALYRLGVHWYDKKLEVEGAATRSNQTILGNYDFGRTE